MLVLGQPPRKMDLNEIGNIYFSIEHDLPPDKLLDDALMGMDYHSNDKVTIVKNKSEGMAQQR